MKTITLTLDKSGYRRIIFFFLICIANGVWIGYAINIYVGLTVILVSVFGGGAFVRGRKHQGGPQLIIDDKGIHDLRYNTGFIPWADIEGGYIQHYKMQDFLCLDLRNPEPYMQRFNPIKRRLVKWNHLLGFTEVAIILLGLTGAKPDEIVAAIRERTGNLD